MFFQVTSFWLRLKQKQCCFTRILCLNMFPHMSCWFSVTSSENQDDKMQTFSHRSGQTNCLFCRSHTYCVRSCLSRECGKCLQMLNRVTSVPGQRRHHSQHPIGAIIIERCCCGTHCTQALLTLSRHCFNYQRRSFPPIPLWLFLATLQVQSGDWTLFW